ncbi:iron hydrogenase [Patescibacteria group bacterium]|nr:iron hydrogenase [Patescibacteria group bacterium]MBU1778603.1 iron hydrogenase [Patescibacteria group bacterium]
MQQTKILTINRKKVFTLTQFTALVVVATTVPLFNQQAITGPVVNATLFVSVALLGVQNAILVGLIPSLVALSTGLLPPVLAPMIPFIMVGNTILIMVFGYLKERNFWLGVITASVLKFLFLFSTSSIVINLLLKKEVATKVAMMMSWPQLLTALVGGLLAFVFLKGIRKI